MYFLKTRQEKQPAKVEGEVDVEGIDVNTFYVRCKETVGKIHLDKLESGGYGKCISYKENKWYEFQPHRHRWIVVEKAHSLIKLISEDVVKQYLKSIYELNKEATARASQLTNVMNDL